MIVLSTKPCTWYLIYKCNSCIVVYTVGLGMVCAILIVYFILATIHNYLILFPTTKHLHCNQYWCISPLCSITRVWTYWWTVCSCSLTSYYYGWCMSSGNIQGVPKKIDILYLLNISGTNRWISKPFFSSENLDPFENFKYRTNTVWY